MYRRTPGKVKVDGGWVQGTVQEGMSVYKGIPFAAPPVGDLRWKAPQHVQPWDTVLSATSFSKSPIQAFNMPGCSEGVPEWPKFDGKNVMYLTGDKPYVGGVPDLESLEVLDGYFAWRRTEEGAAWANGK